MAVNHKHTCPHCLHENDNIADVPGNPNEGRGPAAGDAGLCFQCGNWMIFTDDAPRLPNDEELASLDGDPRSFALRLMVLLAKSPNTRPQ